MNKNLEKVLRVLKHRGLAESTNQTDLAKYTSLSRQTISKLKDDIDTYLTTAPPPSQTDNDFVDKQIVTTYIDLALTSGTDQQHFLQVMGAVAGYVLKNDTNLINNIRTTKKVVRVGFEYMRLVTQVESRKGNKGTPVHSQNGAARYLLTELDNSDLVTSLFFKSSSYRTDSYSKSWKLTEQAEELNKRIIALTIELVDKYNKLVSGVTHFPLHIGDSLCNGESVNLGRVNTSMATEHLLINVQDLAKLSIRSFIQVINIAEPSPPSYILVPLRNLARVDPERGRTYNIFSRLRSSERKALGYNNYDISSGLQIICFNILTQYPLYKYETFDDLHAAYPLIFSYSVDPEFKKALREDIAKDLGKSIDEVKALLTAYSNGSQKKVGDSDKLKEFYKESDQLRREVVATIAQYEPDLLQSAIEQSKNDFPEDTDWQSIEKENTAQQSRDKASVFFFIWTYFEKQIRDAMLSMVDDGIPVHDAIYSKKVVDYGVFEQAILDKTGFDVKIEG
jgi:DNA-binding transcriptional MerR regulator